MAANFTSTPQKQPAPNVAFSMLIQIRMRGGGPRWQFSSLFVCVRLQDQAAAGVSGGNLRPACEFAEEMAQGTGLAAEDGAKHLSVSAGEAVLVVVGEEALHASPSGAVGKPNPVGPCVEVDAARLDPAAQNLADDACHLDAAEHSLGAQFE